MGRKLVHKKSIFMAKLLAITLMVPMTTSPLGIIYADDEQQTASNEVVSEPENISEDTSAEEVTIQTEEPIQETPQTEEPALVQSEPVQEVNNTPSPETQSYVSQSSDNGNMRAEYEALQAKYNELSDSVAQMSSLLNSIQQNMSSQNGSKTMSSADMINMQNQISSLSSRIDSLNNQLNAANRNSSNVYASLSNQSTSLKDNVNSLRSQVNDMQRTQPASTPLVVDMRNGQTGYIESVAPGQINSPKQLQQMNMATVTEIVDVVQTKVDSIPTANENEGVILEDTDLGQIELISQDMSLRELSETDPKSYEGSTKAITDDLDLSLTSQDVNTGLILVVSDTALREKTTQQKGVPLLLAATTADVIYDLSTLTPAQEQLLAEIFLMMFLFVGLALFFNYFIKKNHMLFYKNRIDEDYGEDYEVISDEMLDETFAL
jgi:flagellar biosynthesis chaperone FliJ